MLNPAIPEHGPRGHTMDKRGTKWMPIVLSAQGHGKVWAARGQTCRKITTVEKHPCVTAVGQMKGDQASDAVTALPRRLRVVIVEDDGMIAMELEMLLEDLDAEVLGIAMNANDACALVHDHQPDCVTMDINIRGDRDGVSAAKDIFETYGVRSIFISSSQDPATQQRANACQPIAWIKKPVDPADLCRAIRIVKLQWD